ncbi:MAG: S41 family peptidase [Muribaculaceae bacterium]|nr:S41 family peptidase [Muribaculaceae bacterium]
MKALRLLLITLLALLPATLGLTGCHSVESWDNDYYGNFDALWTVVDEHYCFFREKDLDWEAVGEKYRAQISPDMDMHAFFDLCSDMLAELRDGHVNLSSWFAVSYYREWWSAYPQNFDWRLIQERYLNFDYTTAGGMSYALLDDGKVGYCYYSTFSAPVSDAFINDMFLSMRDAAGLILDLRDNGGGELTNVERIVAHFIDEPILAGYITHKTGPGHGDFSKPYPYSYDPVSAGVLWLRPVIILTNRSTFSAANNLVQVMRRLPNVVVIGDRTGGGSGAPLSSQIPCGWSVRFSASPIYDADMKLTENGIDPDLHIDMTPESIYEGHDNILDKAIELIVSLDSGTSDNYTLKSAIHQ